MLALPLSCSAYDEYIADSWMTSPGRGKSPQSPSKHITVVDVYELASSIGKDFERLIEQHGNESIRGIMPKVISALETLEALASNNERENEEIVQLTKTIDRLENEKQQKQKQHQRIEEEMEQIEDTYRRDINELTAMVQALSHQNRTLSSTLPATVDSPTTQALREEDVRLMLELKDMSCKQKDEIKTLHKDVEQYSCEVENLQNSIEKLIRQNEELVRKNHSLQKQGRMIVEEKVEIMRRLEKTEEANIQLRKMLCDTDRACKDLQQATMLDDEPRFTLAELREVLQEKNVLKGRVMELEEELDNMKPGGAKREKEKMEETPEPEQQLPIHDNDLPVYGPLPREPDEKLYPWKYERKDSGVRKFFRFFADFGSSSSPRRGSSATNSPRPQRTNQLAPN